MSKTPSKTARITVTLPKDVAANLEAYERELLGDVPNARINLSAFVSDAIRTALAARRARKVS